MIIILSSPFRDIVIGATTTVPPQLVIFSPRYPPVRDGAVYEPSFDILNVLG